MVHLCFGLLMKMDVNPNLAGKADLDHVETSGASTETAKQDLQTFTESLNFYSSLALATLMFELNEWGKYIF